VGRGYKGKGVLIHSITDRQGMPLAVCATPANASERDQVLPLLDAVKVKTGRPGRPRKRVKVLAGDKGYEARWLSSKLRKRGIRPQLLKKRRPGGRKPMGRPIKKDAPRFQVERTFSWYQRKFRRLVVRWERIPSCFKAFLDLGFIFMWVQRLLSPGSSST